MNDPRDTKSYSRLYPSVVYESLSLGSIETGIVSKGMRRGSLDRAISEEERKKTFSPPPPAVRNSPVDSMFDAEIHRILAADQYNQQNKLS